MGGRSLSKILIHGGKDLGENLVLALLPINTGVRHSLLQKFDCRPSPFLELSNAGSILQLLDLPPLFLGNFGWQGLPAVGARFPSLFPVGGVAASIVGAGNPLSASGNYGFQGSQYFQDQSAVSAVTFLEKWKDGLSFFERAGGAGEDNALALA